MQQLMWRSKPGLLLIILFLLFSCTPKKKSEKTPFYREEMVLKYISNETGIKESEYLLALVNTTDCGASQINDIGNIKKNTFSKKEISTYYLFTEEETELLESLIDTNDFIIPTDIEILEKYGLRLFTPYLFHLKEGKVINWQKIKK